MFFLQDIDKGESESNEKTSKPHKVRFHIITTPDELEEGECYL